MIEQVLVGARAWHVECGDVRDVLPSLPDHSIDACITDPPYDLIAGSRRGGGFMGLAWDATGVAFRVETWGALLRVLKPGAHLVAFGGTRTYHRMVCAIEDAGFEIRDTFTWLFGSGFPKNLNVGGGLGPALKPGHEPIVLARAPLSERTVAGNVARWGTGALRIDDTRIGGPKAWGSGSPSLRFGGHHQQADSIVASYARARIEGDAPLFNAMRPALEEDLRKDLNPFYQPSDGLVSEAPNKGGRE